jgi:monofunctional glycosyltransferase
MQRTISLFSLGLIALIGWQAYRFYQTQFPKTSVLRSQFPVVIYKGPKEPTDIELRKQKPPNWVFLHEIPKHVQGAVLVSEDWAFFDHKGYDPKQIEEAIKEDLAHGKFKRGASTLTQQVVKNVFLDKDKTLWRKLREFILAVRLEKNVSKRKILEVYFNIAEWGEGIHGIQEAAQAYFRKHPSQLTPKEGAFLAMLLPSPKRYSQSFRAKQLTRYASRTIQNILRNMGRAGYISEEEKLIQMQIPLSFETAALKTAEGLEPEPDPDEEATADVPEGSSKLREEEDPGLQNGWPPSEE